MFGSLNVPVSYINPVQIICKSPAAENPGLVPLSLTYNGADFYDSGFLFEYTSHLSFVDVYPLIGVINGGNLVKITIAEKFPFGTQLFVRFGFVSVPATQISPQTFECFAPNVYDIGKVKISYSLNAVDFSYSPFDYTYVAGSVAYEIVPVVGVVNGGTATKILGANFYTYGSWYCVFGDIAVLGYRVSQNILSCTTPPSVASIENVPVGVYHILNNSLSTLMVTPSVLKQFSTAAVADISFTYESEIVISSIHPTVFFANRDSYITVFVDNIGSSKNISCVWIRGNQTEFTPAVKMKGTSLLCPVSLNDPGTVSLKISVNGFIETKSETFVTFLADLELNSVFPARIVTGSSSNITIFGSNFPLDTTKSNAVCVYSGDTTDDIFVPAHVLSSTKVTCPFPSIARSQEVQNIVISGLEATNEVQVIDVSGATNQTEIQRIQLSTWGKSDPVWRLRLGTNLPVSDQTVVEVATTVSYRSEVQRIKMYPTPYVQEEQMVVLDVVVSDMPEAYRLYEDRGTLAVSIGTWVTDVYWNATEEQMKAAVKGNNAIHDVNVYKFVKSSSIAISSVNITISWKFEFSPCDGDVPQVKIQSTAITRAVSSARYRASTAMSGIACECQVIDIYGAREGSLVLKFGEYATEPLSFTSTVPDLQTNLLHGLSILPNVDVSISVLTASHRKWYITFTDTPGDLSLLSVSNVVSAPSMWGAAKVDVMELSAGKARPLTGSFQINSAGVTGTFSIGSSLTLLQSVIKNAVKIEVGPSASSLVNDWIITFNSTIGDTSMTTISTTGLSDTPIVKITEVVRGSGVDSQTVTLFCPTGQFFGNFTIGIDESKATSLSASSLSVSSITSALVDIGLLRVTTALKISNTTTKVFTVTFLNPNPVETIDGILIVSPPRCDSTGTVYATKSVVRSQGYSRSSIGTLDGLLVLRAASRSLPIPVSASTDVMAEALSKLLLGSTTITRTSSAFGCYTWTITFHELVSPMPTLSANIVDSTNKGIPDVTITTIVSASPGAYGLLNGGSFLLSSAVDNYGVNSSVLSLLSSNSEIQLAFSTVLNIPLTSIFVSNQQLPAGGISWDVKIQAYSPVHISSIEIIHLTLLKLGTSSSLASTTLLVHQSPTVADMHRLVIHADSALSGTFRLSHSGVFTDYMSVDISYQLFEELLTRALGIQKIRIRPITFGLNFSYPGDYRAWDIEFISVAGSAPILQCDVHRVNESYTGEDATCKITRVHPATSSAVSGSISLKFNGSSTVPFSVSTSALALQNLMKNNFQLDVDVSRKEIEFGSDVQWFVTFISNRGDEDTIVVETTSLLGTSAVSEVTELRRGSVIGGNYAIEFMEKNSTAVAYDASAEDLELAINSLSPIIDVTVSRLSLNNGYRYFVTFLTPVSDVDLLKIDDSNILGSSSSVKVIEYLRGVGYLSGYFRLSRNNETTGLLNISASASEIETAIENLSSVGDVTVTSLIGQKGWQITYTTMGSPTNAGLQPLFEISETINMGFKFSVVVERMSTACCDIYFSFNNGYDQSSKHISLVVDDIPTVTEVDPILGSITGGTQLAILGSGFFSTNDETTCVFGVIETAAKVYNSSFATCFAPPHPPGDVIVSLNLHKVKDSYDRSSIARSATVFKYEHDLIIVNSFPMLGVIDQKTKLTFKLSDIGSELGYLQCVWNITILSPVLGQIVPPLQYTKAFAFNTTYCSCLTPNISTLFIDPGNDDWYWDTNATASVVLTKNNQSFSNEMRFVFASKYSLSMVSPAMVMRSGGVDLTLNGRSFVSSNESRCRVGATLFPLRVISVDTAVCSIGEIMLKPPQHSIRVLAPKISTEVQIIEVWRRQDINSSMAGFFSIILESVSSSPIIVSSSAIQLKTLLQQLPRVKSVDVVTYSNVVNDLVDGFIFNVTTYSITFVSRDDDVPLIRINSTACYGLHEGEKIISRNVIDGGSVVYKADVKSWKIFQPAANPHILDITIFVPEPTFEVQKISLSSKGVISGFFYVIFDGKASKRIASEASAMTLETVLRSVPGLDHIKVSRTQLEEFGFTWTITFTSLYPYPLPLISVKNDSLPSGCILKSINVINGSRPLGGTFSLSSSGKQTHQLFLNTSVPLFVDEVESTFGLFGVQASKYENSTFSRWVVTFPPSTSSYPVIHFGLTTLKGTGVKSSVSTVQQGGRHLNGNYNLALLGKNMSIPFNSSTSGIQSILQSALSTKIGNYVVLVDLISSSSDYFEWTATFPISIGQLPSPTITLRSNIVGNGNVTYTAWTSQLGTYKKLGGSFKIAFDGLNSSAIPYNATATDVEKALTLFYPSIQKVTVIANYADVTYNGYLYSGATWLITYDALGTKYFDGIVPLAIVNSALTGTEYVTLLEESYDDRGSLFPVEITFNGQHYTSNGNLIEVVEPVYIKSIEPAFGVGEGGTRIQILVVSVYESNKDLLRYEPNCVIGGFWVNARYLNMNGTLLECYTPSPASLVTSNLTVDVKLVINNQQFSLNSIYFTYQPIIKSQGITLTPNFGSKFGGTVLNITSSSIVASSKAYCSFNDMIVVADFIDDGIISCRTPSVPFATIVGVGFSTNGFDYVNVSHLKFSFMEPPVVKRIDPVRGSSKGMTHVKVYGENFMQSSNSTFCRFGDQVVPSTFTSYNTISCIAPALRRVYEVQTLKLGLTPFLPAIQNVTVVTTPNTTGSIKIETSASYLATHVEKIDINITDVNAVQEIVVSQNHLQPFEAVISVPSRSIINEIQVISTNILLAAETQAILIRTSFYRYQSSYEEVVQVTYTRANVYSTDILSIVLYGTGKNMTFGTFSSDTDMERLLFSRFGLASTVSSTVVGLGRVFTLRFDASYGNVPPLMSSIMTGTGTIRSVVLSEGGFAEIQRVNFKIKDGSVILAHQGSVSGSIPLSSSQTFIEDELESMGLGQVSVSVNVASSGNPSWTITFLELCGDVPDLNVTVPGGSQSYNITTVRNGTTVPVQGYFTLQYRGSESVNLTTASTQQQIYTAVKALVGCELSVTRYSLMNIGVMFVLKFDLSAGNIDHLIVNQEFLSATNLDIEVVTQVDGSSMKGSYLLGMVEIDNYIQNEQCLSYNASSDDVEKALLRIDPLFKGVTVTRSNGDVPGTFSWSVTFPMSLGNVKSLVVNGAGLLGEKPSVTVTELVQGRVPTVQRIVSTASSSLSGGFYLMYGGRSTSFLPYNVNSAVLQMALEALPGVGTVSVSRTATGVIDAKTWNLLNLAKTYVKENNNVVNHLDETADLFEYDLGSFEWQVTFRTKAGTFPLIQVCCSELQTGVKSNVTLKSRWSRDSVLFVDTVVAGTTEQLYGNLSVSVNSSYTEFFALNATADTVQKALQNVGVSDITVSRSAIDENNLYAWTVTFLNRPVTFLDTYFLPPLGIDSSQVYPFYGQIFPSFEWASTPQSHAIVRLSVDGSATCSIFDSLGSILSTVSILSSNLSHIQTTFDSKIAYLGPVTVAPTVDSKVFLLIFQTLCCNIQAHCSSNIDTDVIQNGTEVYINGSIVVGYETSSIIVPSNSSAVTMEAYLNSILGPGSVEVSKFMRSTSTVWAVTFSGPLVQGPVSLLNVQPAADFVGVNSIFNVTEIQQGNKPNGFIVLSIGNRYPLYVDVDSTSDDLFYLLKAYGINILNVEVIRNSSYSWVFSRTLLNETDVSISINVGNATGTGIAVSSSVLVNGSIPIYGSFVLAYSSNTKKFRISSSDDQYAVEKILKDTDPVLFGGSTVSTYLTNLPPKPNGFTKIIPTVTSPYPVFPNIGNGARTWIIQLANTKVPPTISVYDTSLLKGSHVKVIVATTTPKKTPLRFFGLSFNGTISSVQLSQKSTAMDFENALKTIPELGPVKVSRNFNTSSSTSWLVTFLSLRQAGISSLLNIDPIGNYKINATITMLRKSFYVPILSLTVPSGDTNFTLFWDSATVSTFSSNVTSKVLTFALQKLPGVQFVNIESYVSSAGINTWLIQVIPSVGSYSEFISDSSVIRRLTVLFPSLFYRCQNYCLNTNMMQSCFLTGEACNDDFDCPQCSPFVPSPLPVHSPLSDSNIGQSQLFLSLGEQGCKVFNEGVFCKSEEVVSVSVPPTVHDISNALTSLRDIQEVQVSLYDVSFSRADEGYLVYGFNYVITFLKHTLNSPGSKVSDINEFTWTPYVAEIQAVEDSTKIIYDIPLLDASLSNGSWWFAEVSETTRGSNPNVEEIVALEVSLNGQDWSSQDTHYSFIQIPRVFNIFPDHGPVRGGTEIIIYGENFVRSSLLSCHFGYNEDMRVSAVHYFNSSVIICISPGSKYLMRVDVVVSNNGVLNYNDFTSSSVVYTYDSPIDLIEFVPPFGPISGNFSVKISGGPFYDTDQLRCKFGDRVIKAFYLDEGHIHCFAPPYPMGACPLEVTNNDQDYTQLRKPFYFYQDPALSRISPVSGPARTGGTLVYVYGQGFINTTYLTCKFGQTNTKGRFVTSSSIICPSPQLDIGASGGLTLTALSEQRNKYPDPFWLSTYGNTTKLFPDAISYPLYSSRLVTVEVSNNNQDFTASGINFLYQEDAFVDKILPNTGFVNEPTPILIYGNNFVNSSLLRCRIGEYVSRPVFLSRVSVLCYTPRIPLIQFDQGYVREGRIKTSNTPNERMAATSPGIGLPTVVYVEVANNGNDFTNDRLTFTFNVKCKTGYYCPQLNAIVCPPGTYCAGEFNTNFTLCPKGTYNPKTGQSDCFRCPVGFACPEQGMQVPRICPAGFVCEFTGTTIADNPCPEGHFCLEGTATSATSCGHPEFSSGLYPTMSHAERSSTLRKARIAQGQLLFLGARNSGCWTNATDDFGLQGSDQPALIWAQKHLLPLAVDSPFTPLRGKFCLDDACLRFSDVNDYVATGLIFIDVISTSLIFVK